MPLPPLAARHRAPAASTISSSVAARSTTGRGGARYVGDVPIDGDRITAIGDLGDARRRDARSTSAGRAVSPGIHQHAELGRRVAAGRRPIARPTFGQGVTLEVFGEGWSMGPLNAPMQERWSNDRPTCATTCTWTTLGGYLEHLERQGVSTNVASFVGADDRPHPRGRLRGPGAAAGGARPMRALVGRRCAKARSGSAPPCPTPRPSSPRPRSSSPWRQVAARHGGMYISHVRDEGDTLLESLDEFLEIVRAARVAARSTTSRRRARRTGRRSKARSNDRGPRRRASRHRGHLPLPRELDRAHLRPPHWVQEGDPSSASTAWPTGIRARVIPEMDMIPPEDMFWSTSATRRCAT